MLTKPVILLVDDDAEIKSLLETTLSRDYAFYSVGSLKQARDFLGRYTPDLILLDDELPDGRGVEIFQQMGKRDLNAAGPTVLMLTKRGSVENKLAAFEMGAEDYITKPFEPREVLARIQLRLRRQPSQLNNVQRIDDIELDVLMSKAYILEEEEKREIEMTPIEFKILYLLASRRGDILTRQDILREVWGKSQHVIERTVDQHISKIRKKLQESTFTVRSAHGRGYAFVKNA